MSFTLEDVKRLGGTKDEFEALGGIESGSEMEFGAEGGAEGGAKLAGEIEAYVHRLGLDTMTCGPAEEALEVTRQERKGKLKEREENGSAVEPRKKKKTRKDEEEEPTSLQKSREKNRKKPSKEKLHVIGDDGACGRQEVERRLLGLSASTPHTRLLVSPDSQQLWFDQSQSTEVACTVSETVLAHLRSVGQQLMETEAQLYEKVRVKKKGVSDVRWLKNVLSSGTLSDKVAAHTLLVQESPVHSLSSLDWLLGLVAKGGGNAMKGLHAKRKGILATNTLKELWVSELLPEHRKLKYLKQRPLNLLLHPSHPSHSSHTAQGSRSSSHSWQYSLLLWFFEDQLKSRYLQFVYTLQAATHDSVEEVREKMLGHVFDLLYQRPEQEKQLLSQLVNKLGDPLRKVASKTVLFLLKLLNHHVKMKLIVTKEIESLLHRPNISAKAQYYGVCCLNQLVLTSEDGPLVAKLIDVYFTFFKVIIKQDKLDSKMLGAILTGVNRAFPYMSEELPSFEDHLHSLFKVVHVGPISIGIQSLLLLHQVMESRQSVSERYYNALYSKLLDPALRHCHRQAMFLNVLFKSLKSDPSMNRVKAFVKRMLHVCVCHSPSFICGCLLLLSELLRERPALWPYVLQGNDEENYRDVPTNSAGEDGMGDGEEGDMVEGEGVRGEEGDVRVERERSKVEANLSSYKISHRNPQFCGAENTCLWELKELCCHYHPTVQLFSKKIASGEGVQYPSDPLEDFTVIKFLDRFVYKNPKLKHSDHGGSLMQRTLRGGMTTNKELMANSAAFAALDESKVDVKDLFMHRYLSQRGRSCKRKRRVRDEEGYGSEGEQSYTDMDFAGEVQREVRDSKQHTSQKKKKKRTKGDNASDKGEDSMSSEEDNISGEFNYDDMDEQALGDSEGEGEGGRDDTMSDAHLEKVLLENMSDDDNNSTERDKERGKGAKKSRAKLSLKGNFDPNKMFAAADEFSHLLEDGQSADRGSNVKQLAWEEKQSGQQSRKRERRGKGRGRGRGRGRGKGGGEKDVSKGRERGDVKTSVRGRRGRGGVRGGRGVKRERVERGSRSNQGAFSVTKGRGRSFRGARGTRNGRNYRT